MSETDCFGHLACLFPLVRKWSKFFGDISADCGSERIVQRLVVWIRREVELLEKRLREGSGGLGCRSHG